MSTSSPSSGTRWILSAEPREFSKPMRTTKWALLCSHEVREGVREVLLTLKIPPAVHQACLERLSAGSSRFGELSSLPLLREVREKIELTLERYCACYIVVPHRSKSPFAHREASSAFGDLGGGVEGEVGLKRSGGRADSGE